MKIHIAVVPAKAGTHFRWIPAFAGMTQMGNERGFLDQVKSLDFAIFANFAPLRETAGPVTGLTDRFTAFRMDALKAPACIQKENRHKRSDRVNTTVLNRSGPPGDKALVVFIRQ